MGRFIDLNLEDLFIGVLVETKQLDLADILEEERDFDEGQLVVREHAPSFPPFPAFQDLRIFLNLNRFPTFLFYQVKTRKLAFAVYFRFLPFFLLILF